MKKKIKCKENLVIIFRPVLSAEMMANKKKIKKNGEKMWSKSSEVRVSSWLFNSKNEWNRLHHSTFANDREEEKKSTKIIYKLESSNKLIPLKIE